MQHDQKEKFVVFLSNKRRNEQWNNLFSKVTVGVSHNYHMKGSLLFGNLKCKNQC
jgi:hypothetical protein